MASTFAAMGAMRSVAVRRLVIAFIQGVFLYLLVTSAELGSWPATNAIIYKALMLPLLFAPLVAIHAESHLPKPALYIWTGVVAFLTAILGAYDAWRSPEAALLADTAVPVVIAIGFGLFIAEALVLAAQAGGKRVADYPIYFDAVCKHAVQLFAGGAFVAALCLVLVLGARLFDLINLKFLSTLIEQRWFAIPATAVALATAIHATDLRHSLVHGIRTLALTLLSWLLPVLAVIVTGFLISLPFTGLQPLWDTRFAAALLLATAAALVVLINAAFQDGSTQAQGAPALRWTLRVAMILPAPLVGIAAYALTLRVQQYGWTTDRVYALACVVVGICFGAGYFFAALRPRDLLKRLALTNVAASLVVLAVLFSLLTPLADPARIAVASQVARLAEGRTTAEAFDYKYLRLEGGRHGADALARMEAGEFQIAGVAERAAQAATLTVQGPGGRLDKEGLALNITVSGGSALPPSFLAQDWASIAKDRRDYPPCLRRPAERCEAFVMDFNGDGANEIILVSAPPGAPPTVFQHNDNMWDRIGELPARLACEDMRALLRAGQARTVASRWSDVEIGGVRMDVAEKSRLDRADCAPS